MLSEKIQEILKGRVGRIVIFVILLLISIPFIFTGIERYTPGATAGSVAHVGDREISVNEYDEALKSEQNRMREAGERDPKRLNSKEVKTRVLDQLIRQQLILQQASKLGYSLDEAAVIASIQRDPNFQENGVFSQARLQAFLQYNRMNQKQYIAALAQNRMLRELLALQADTNIAARTTLTRLAAEMAEQREIAKATVKALDYAAQAKIDTAQIQAYYTAHPELSRTPEQVRVQYIVLSPESLLANQNVTDADAQAYFKAHQADFAPPEQRDIAQILIRALPDAKPAERQAAQEKAQQVLQLAQKNPADFAALAKQYSQDPLSASHGGDMGSIARGTIFKQIEDAAFSMKPGEVRGLVQSPAGFHILYLKAIKGGGAANYEDVKVRVMDAAKRDLAMRKFNESLESFGDAVYAKQDSLQFAADQFHLPVQTSDWFGRSGPKEGVLKNERLLNALFSNDVIKDKRNTEAIEVAPNTLVAARIMEYKAAANKPLEAVRGEIEARLRSEQAAKLTASQGANYLAELRAGKTIAALKFDAPAKLDREQALKAGMDQATMQAVYGASVQKLPAYAGVAGANGDYTIYKITAIGENAPLLAQAKQYLPLSLAQAQSDAVALAYIDSLRTEYKVKIKQDVIDKIGEDKS